jgi:ribonuclease BN (tRNA processing enzyme)
MPTATLIRMDGLTVLVDAGLGATRGICDAGVPLTGLDAIIVTHLHSDHYLELGPLIHTAWTAGLKRPIPVYGPDGLAEYWRGFQASMAFDIDLRLRDEGRPAFAPLLDLRPMTGASLDLGPVSVSLMRNDHPPIEDSYALRFDGAQHRITLSGDTAPMHAMAKFAHDSDLLIHEAMLTAGIEALLARIGNGDDRLRQHLFRSHTPAAEAARIAEAAGTKRLALHHLVPCDDPDFTDDDWRAECEGLYTGALFIGTDGLEIELD